MHGLNQFLLVLFIIAQILSLNSYAENKKISAQNSISLSIKEILNLSKEKKIEYLKSLREIAEATESTQTAFYGSDYISASVKTSDFKTINQILKYTLFNEVIAVDTNGVFQNSCIIAGNPGLLIGGRCNFTSESKSLNSKCGVGKVACNPALYGDNMCISFVSVDDKKNATAHCNAKDFNYNNVINKYSKDDMTAALAQIEEQANSIFKHCVRARNSKKITKDQDQTCKVLENRISKLGATACKDIRKSQDSSESSTDPLLMARIKSCNEILKSSCESKASQLEKSAEELNKACSANGFKTGQLVSPACYPELEKCKKNGFSDKCFSSRETKDLKTIESDVAPIKANLSKLVGESADSLKSCFPATEPKLDGKSTQVDLDNRISYDDYQKFLKLKTYDYKGDSQLHSQLQYAKNNVEDQRKSWQMYLARVSAENEKIIKAIEKHLSKCQLSDSEKSTALSQLSHLKTSNEQISNKFRHNQDLVFKTKDEKLGILEANDIKTNNKGDLDIWFNSANPDESSFKNCCLSPGNKGQSAYLLNNKWCNKSSSGIASRIYEIPSSSNAGPDDTDKKPEEFSPVSTGQ